MTKNVGSLDRVFRALAGVAMLVCSVMAPLPWLVRGTAFGLIGIFMLGSALVGTCLGYRLMGKSTCPRGAHG